MKSATSDRQPKSGSRLAAALGLFYLDLLRIEFFIEN